MDRMDVHCEFSSGQKPSQASDLVGRLSKSGLLALEADSDFLPGLKRALSVPATSSCSLDKTTPTAKPTFRIQLPPRTHTSLSLPIRPLQQTPVTATHFPSCLAEDTLFASFRGTPLLTPPDERTILPLETVVHTTKLAQQTSSNPSQIPSSLLPPFSTPSKTSLRSESPRPSEEMAETPKADPAGASSLDQVASTPNAIDASMRGIAGNEDSANAPQWLGKALDVVRK